ncbi:MAG: hypothetical protein ACOCUW_02160 [Gemmatimonadota bacterium]
MFVRSAFVAALLLVAVGARGQSVTSVQGLGYPMVGADARAEALGGLGIGLMGTSASLTNPASVAGTVRRGVVVSGVATERTSTLGDASAGTGTTRFPLIRLLFPMGRVVLTAGYGAFLDQSWSVARDGALTVVDQEVAYQDVVESTGGVGQAQIGAAIPVGRYLALGVAVGTYTGGQDVSLRRTFDPADIGTLEPYTEDRAVRYSGLLTRVGFRLDAGSMLRVGGSATWSGRLTADSVEGPVPGTAYDLPLQLAAGASAYLSPGLLATVSGRWSGWSGTDPSGGLGLADGDVDSRDTWELGAGLEIDDPASRAARSFPIRAGFQYRELPFSFGDESPSEWAAGLGVGLRIGPDITTPLARIDLTVQRGARTAPGSQVVPALDETFWRFVVGISIFGT